MPIRIISPLPCRFWQIDAVPIAGLRVEKMQDGSDRCIVLQSARVEQASNWFQQPLVAIESVTLF